ncbi:protein of unknown function [Agreia sp. COWG]|nr:protein of unknown function [Agreia sp. COWG]
MGNQPRSGIATRAVPRLPPAAQASSPVRHNETVIRTKPASRTTADNVVHVLSRKEFTQ